MSQRPLSSGCQTESEALTPARVARCLTMSLGLEELSSGTTEKERKAEEEAETLEISAQCLIMTILVTE